MILASLGTGLLLGTSFIPFPPWAALFGLVPLWLYWLRAPTFRVVLLSAWLTQFLISVLVQGWFVFGIHEFMELSWAKSLGLFLLFAAVANYHYVVAGALFYGFDRAFRPRRYARVASLVAIFALAEGFVPRIFDWHFGYSWLYAGLPAFQLADVIGFLGLSAVTLAVNGALAEAWLRRRESRARNWLLAGAMAGFGLLNAFGAIHGATDFLPDRSTKILVVQANVGNEEKLRDERQAGGAARAIQRYGALTRAGIAAHGKPDFAMWPETAVPVVADRPSMGSQGTRPLRDTVASLGTKLITGGYAYLPGGVRQTNAVMALGEDGTWIAPPYHKSILVPFSEAVPGARAVPWLAKLFPKTSDYDRGAGTTTLAIGDLRAGMQICYEGLFDWFANQLAQQGAEILLNHTNDAWFGPWLEPYQHLYITLGRAVETRRPLVRVTNSGFTQAILASGALLPRSPLGKEWVHAYEIPYRANPPLTLFTRGGIYIVPLAALAILLIAILTSDRASRWRRRFKAPA